MPNPIQNMPEMLPSHDGVDVTAKNWLPWDYGQFRKSDIGFGIVAIVCCVVIPLINVPMIKKIIPQRTVLAPVEVAAPIVQPKPVPPPPPPKKEGGAKPEPEKAMLRAAAPNHPLPKPQAPSQVGSPDKPPVQTVRPARATADAGPTKQAATSPNPTPLPSDTPAAVSHNTGPSAAEIQAAAQKRAQGLVAATGLGTAIGSLTNGTSSNPKAVEGRGLQHGGVEGGRPDVKLGAGGGGTGGNGSARSGVKFGSATDGDKTGHGTGNLSGRGTDDVSGGKIKGNGNGGTGSGKGDASGKGRDDVKRIMDQNAGRVQGAYKRALDDDPTMQGSFTVRLKIAPDGHVISVSVVSSDLNNSALESKLKAIIQSYQFSSGNFDTFEGNYKYNFIQ
ncbi:MAG: AgmX/PglI C-terminal domain-containing protein [Gammaproteobacteria bacterium]|nr:AgmX/PglI C-terminal domain-containing protein [Gammaproteobacteria bacterium]